jgi:signal transduction histidine kinase
LSTGRQTFGALTFVTAMGGRRFADADLAFANQLAGRVALAIDNARLYQGVRDANRVKDEFLATLSHELRTPLNVILGRTKRLSDTADQPDTVRRNAETISRNAETLTRLVEDLLDVSRFTLGQVTLDIRPIDLPALVASVVTSLEPTARTKRVALRSDVMPGCPAMLGDQTRMQQVIWNLLTNAIKFTPESGTVTVEVTHENGALRLQVEDTGIGVPPEFLPHMFDMFRQAEPAGKRNHGGLGVGLSIVRKLVELHGGTVVATSKGPGQGATFTVHLPCSHVMAPPPAADDPASQRA